MELEVGMQRRFWVMAGLAALVSAGFAAGGAAGGAGAEARHTDGGQALADDQTTVATAEALSLRL